MIFRSQNFFDDTFINQETRFAELGIKATLEIFNFHV